MTAKLARLTLRLYPHAFQRRYGDEMRALLQQSPPGAREVLDLMRGALAGASASARGGRRVRGSWRPPARECWRRARLSRN